MTLRMQPLIKRASFFITRETLKFLLVVPSQELIRHNHPVTRPIVPSQELIRHNLPVTWPIVPSQELTPTISL